MEVPNLKTVDIKVLGVIKKIKRFSTTTTIMHYLAMVGDQIELSMETQARMLGKGLMLWLKEKGKN